MVEQEQKQNKNGGAYCIWAHVRFNERMEEIPFSTPENSGGTWTGKQCSINIHNKMSHVISKVVISTPGETALFLLSCMTFVDPMRKVFKGMWLFKRMEAGERGSANFCAKRMNVEADKVPRTPGPGADRSDRGQIVVKINLRIFLDAVSGCCGISLIWKVIPKIKIFKFKY